MFSEILKAAFPIIEKTAPVLAGALGSPLAGMGANFAISLLSSKFGIKPKDIEDLSHSILNDPNAEDKLTELEETFAHWFATNTSKIPLPSNAELNIKVNWNRVNESVG